MGYKVIRGNGDFESWDELEIGVQDYATYLKTNIFMANPHGGVYPDVEIQADCLNILFWSSPDAPDFNNKNYPERTKIWGYVLKDGQKSYTVPSRQEGIKNILSPEGITCAQVEDNVIHVMFDLPHGPNARTLISSILNATIDKQFIKIKPVDPSMALDSYIEQFNKSDIVNAEGAAEQFLGQLNSLRTNFQLTTKSLQQAQVKVEALKNLSVKTGEYERILKTKKVERVEVNRAIMVYTENLFVVDTRTKLKHDLGKFCIKVTLGNPSLVVMNNLTRQVNGYQANMNAPHVYTAGNACFGSAEETVQKLLIDKEIAALVTYLIMFLESANVDDSAGRYVNKWPLAVEPGQTAIETVREVASAPSGDAVRTNIADVSILPVLDIEVGRDEDYHDFAAPPTVENPEGRAYEPEICSECNQPIECIGDDCNGHCPFAGLHPRSERDEDEEEQEEEEEATPSTSYRPPATYFTYQTITTDLARPAVSPLPTNPENCPHPSGDARGRCTICGWDILANPRRANVSA